MVGREAPHDRRAPANGVPTVQVALRQALAADEDAAVTPRVGDRGEVALDRTLVDHRAEPVGPDERIADHDLLRLLHEESHELVVNAPLDVDPAVRGALLAAEAEGASGRCRPPPRRGPPSP